MKYLLRIVLLTMLLSSAICRAEKQPVTHNFQSDSADPTKLKFSNSNHTGTTPLLTYTCTGGAVFGPDLSGNKKVAINLASSGNTVTTTAVDSLTVIDIYHYPSSSKCENIKVQLSRDSVHWTGPMEADYYKGRIWLRFIPGKYFVRFTNTSSTKVSIYQIEYSFDGCDCFLYIPEDKTSE